MSKLGNYIVKIRNRFEKQDAPIPRQTVNYAQAKNIGILFLVEKESEQDAINQLVSQLQKEGKQLKMLTFVDKITNNPYYFKYDAFTSKDISPLGKINAPDVAHFVNTRFDYLCCILAKPFPLFESIMQKSQAKCRVGAYFPNQEKNYELMISLNEENIHIETLIKEMMLFVRKLKAA